MNRLQRLLESLEVPQGSLVYLHTSFSRLSHLQLAPETFLEALIDYLGPQGTLVLPSFSWNTDTTGRPWKGYQDYFSNPRVFDVTHTKANIGIVPECFRQRNDVLRSLSYWWSVAAVGPLAGEITQHQQNIEHPYGPGSSFDQIRKHNGYILGLGVTLNTTSLAFVPDYSLSNANHLTSEPQIGAVADALGKIHQTRSYWVRPEAVQHVKPQNLFQPGSPLVGQLRRQDHGEVIQFAYPYAAFHQEALSQGRAAREAGRPFPWWSDCPQLCGLKANG